MEFEATDWNIDDFSEGPLDNVLIFISDGKVKKAQLPPFGEINIVTHENKVKSMTYKNKVLFN